MVHGRTVGVVWFIVGVLVAVGTDGGNLLVD